MEPKYTDKQRKAALVCVVLIVLVYIASLVFALLKFEWAKDVAKIALGCTLVLPILTWVYIWMYGKMAHKHTIADFDMFGVPTNHDGIVVNPEEKAESEEKNETEDIETEETNQ